MAAGVERIASTSFLDASPDSTFVLGCQHHATGPTARPTGHPPPGLRELLARHPSLLDPLRSA